MAFRGLSGRVVARFSEEPGGCPDEFVPRYIMGAMASGVMELELEVRDRFLAPDDETPDRVEFHGERLQDEGAVAGRAAY